ncbi:MAG: hypothetical protein ACOYXN_11130 [Acidobacteriota bacterium]
MVKVFEEVTDPREDPFFGGVGALIPYRLPPTDSSEKPSTANSVPQPEIGPDGRIVPDSPFLQVNSPTPPYPAPPGKEWIDYDGVWTLLPTVR